jgi:hypothetical protein
MIRGLVRWMPRHGCGNDPFSTGQLIGQSARHLMATMAMSSVVMMVCPAVEMDMGPAAGIMSVLACRMMAMRARRPLQEQLQHDRQDHQHSHGRASSGEV